MLIGVSIQCCARLQAATKDAALDSMQDFFADMVTECIVPSTKVPISTTVLAASVELLRSLGRPVLESKLLPALSRSLKRNVDTALPAYVWVLHTVKLDLSSTTAEVLKIFPDYLKSKTDPHRDYAVAAFTAYAARCTDSDAAKQVRQLRHRLGPFLTQFSALHHRCTRRVTCFT